MTDLVPITWADIDDAVSALCARIPARCSSVWGVPRGGVPVAVAVSERTGLTLVAEPTIGTLIVDDLVDSGRTLTPWHEDGHDVDALFQKPTSPRHLAPEAAARHGWLVFPWERGETPAEDAVVRLLQAIGEDPDRDGLRDTPRRVVKALGEMTCGYLEDPADILATVFDVDFDEMIVVRRIPFVSLCEHHLLTFVGHATVGYVPKDLVVGLSKLARLVDCYARRLQVQERMTRQIADAIDTHLRPAGVAVLIESTHSCMSSRGVAKVAPMVTSDVRGCFRDQPEARAEFMALARGAT